MQPHQVRPAAQLEAMKHLVLLGAGQAHLQLLSKLARKPTRDVRISLIAPSSVQLFAPMVPGFVAGHRSLEECVIGLDTLHKRAGVHWLNRPVAALEVGARTVELDNGSTFGFDWLSVNMDLAQDRRQIEAALPGAREHGLFLRPLTAFCALWPRVAELGAGRALRIAVLGATHEAIELALAIGQRLPNAALTLVSDDGVIAAHARAATHDHRLPLLKQHKITLLPDSAVRVEAEQILLTSGARLACDVALLTVPSRSPNWLTQSGLSLDDKGFVALDDCRRSLSHDNVFAANDAAGRADPALVNNLMALLSGIPARPYARVKGTLRLTAYGNRCALLEWGRFSTRGRWVGWLKDRIDQRYLQHYRVD